MESTGINELHQYIRFATDVSSRFVRYLPDSVIVRTDDNGIGPKTALVEFRVQDTLVEYDSFFNLHKVGVLSLAIAVSALLGCGETIEIDRASFSGRVVDETGNPVAGLALVISPCDGDDETSIAVYYAVTNHTGHFSITRIYPGKVQFMLVTEFPGGLPPEPEYQLLSFKIGVLAYSPKERSAEPCTQDTFFIAPGARIENVEVIVRLKPTIQEAPP